MTFDESLQRLKEDLEEVSLLQDSLKIAEDKGREGHYKAFLDLVELYKDSRLDRDHECLIALKESFNATLQRTLPQTQEELHKILTVLCGLTPEQEDELDSSAILILVTKEGVGYAFNQIQSYEKEGLTAEVYWRAKTLAKAFTKAEAPKLDPKEFIEDLSDSNYTRFRSSIEPYQSLIIKEFSGPIC